MTPGVRRVSVNQVPRLCVRQRCPEIGGAKGPLAGRENFCYASDLVDDLRHVGLGEPVGFVTIRDIELPAAIESYHAIKARPV